MNWTQRMTCTICGATHRTVNHKACVVRITHWAWDRDSFFQLRRDGGSYFLWSISVW